MGTERYRYRCLGAHPRSEFLGLWDMGERAGYRGAPALLCGGKGQLRAQSCFHKSFLKFKGFIS